MGKRVRKAVRISKREMRRRAIVIAEELASESDARHELIQTLLPLGLAAVGEQLQAEVERLTGARYSRDAGALRRRLVLPLFCAVAPDHGCGQLRTDGGRNDFDGVEYGVRLKPGIECCSEVAVAHDIAEGFDALFLPSDDGAPEAARLRDMYVVDWGARSGIPCVHGFDELPCSMR